mgnify:CR=1 FL=1
MASEDIGATQVGVFKLLADLNWWTIQKACQSLGSGGADQAMRRLALRGYLDMRIGTGLPRRYEYRLSVKGLEIACRYA